MSNTDITRLVVGEPFKKALGSPVTQQGAATEVPEGSTLRWVDGRWEQKTKSLEEHLRSIKLPSASSIKLRAGRPGRLKLPKGPVARFSVEVVIAFLIGLPMAIYFARSGDPSPQEGKAASTVELPLDSRPVQEGAGIREVNGNYTPPPEEAPIGENQPGRVTPTPVQQVPIQAPGQPARVVVPTIPSRGAPQPKEVEQPAKAPRDEGKGQQASAPVILDEDVAREQPKAPNTAAQLPPAVDQRNAQLAQTRVALVAVLPDGKTALFTDPKTRLPVQYRVGDKLTNGETVKAIDAKTGKVTTDKKIYVLE